MDIARNQYVARINTYLRMFKTIHYESLGSSSKMRTNMVGKGAKEMKLGDMVFFFKNEDQEEKGIIFGKLKEKINSDYRIEISNGKEVILPYERIRILTPSSRSSGENMYPCKFSAQFDHLLVF